MTEVTEMKKHDTKVLELLTAQKAAPQDKKSSFDGDIAKERAERAKWYAKYVKSLKDQQQDQSIKDMKDLLGHNPY